MLFCHDTVITSYSIHYTKLYDIIGREDFCSIETKMSKVLSPLEMQVLKKYIDGKSYFEVAEELDRSVKSVDNALQRVKNKLDVITSYSIHYTKLYESFQYFFGGYVIGEIKNIRAFTPV